MEVMMKGTKKTVKTRAQKMAVSTPSIAKSFSLYDTDFSAWVRRQARLLMNREYGKLDVDNLIEEIESLGRSEKRTLISYLEVLLMHMLKVKFQPKKHTVSWDLSIEEAKRKSHKTLSENPSLKPKLQEIFAEAYSYARLRAAKETKLKLEKFPEEAPWALKEIFPDLEKKYCA